VTEPSVETDLAKKVSSTLNDLIDEETKRKFGELNVVTAVEETSPGSFKIRFRSLSPYSPLAVDVGREIRRSALSVSGVRAVEVESTGHMMDDLINRLVNVEAKPQVK